MAEVRDQRQRERAEARAGRRPSADDVSDEQPDESGAGGVDLKRAAATALTAALTGALVGAAKSVADKRGRSAEAEHDDPDEEPSEDRPEPEDHEPDTTEDEPEVTDEHEDEDEDEEPQDDPPPQQSGAPSDDIASIISRAKEHVEAVIGSEAESVSGVERMNGNWRVSVEVVQMRRIPESTDILASYGVVLDGDGDLISVQEVRRYRRSQADDDR
jgi:hypothetical protein